MRRAHYLVGGGLAALALVMLAGASGGFPSRPRFSTVTITGEITGIDGGLELTRTDAPALYLTDSDAAANEKRYRLVSSQGQFEIQSRRDNDTNKQTAFAANRTGEVLDDVYVGGDGAGAAAVNVRLLATTAITANGVPVARVTSSQTAVNGSTMAVGDVILISKSADQTFNSGTCTADTHLQVTNLPTGHYALEGYGIETGGADGLRLCTSDANLIVVTSSVCGGGAGVVSFSNNAGGSLCAGANTWRIAWTGDTTKAFTGGTVGLAWRTNTLGGASSTVESDTYIRVTRLN